MQAGKFGIPQSRRRFILIGAAAGEILPDIPKPISIFSSSSLSLKLGNTIFLEEDRDGWGASAPFRTIKIQDAISDLPPILSGDQVRLVSINYFKIFYLNTILFPNTSK
jgi:DNA (cytosine-5)-methyltransferase 1